MTKIIPVDKIRVGTRIRKDIGDIADLARSIFEVGLINPITVTDDYTLIAGERRLSAVKSLGWPTIECRLMDFDSKAEVDENNIRKDFTVSERVQAAQILEERERVKAKERQGQRNDLIPFAKNDAEVSKPNRTVDRVAEKTGFGSGRTYEKAKYVVERADPNLVEQLDQGKISVHSAYIAVKKQEERETREADAKETKVPQGVYLGDCLTILPKLADGSIDCLITDPPYGMEYKSNMRQYEADVNQPIKNDKPEEAYGLFFDAMKIIDKKMKPDSHIYVFASWKTEPMFRSIIEQFFEVKNVLCWVKHGGFMGDIYNNYGDDYELIIYATRGSRSLMRKRVSNVFNVSKVTESERDHPTQKPVELLMVLIDKSTVEGEVVLDPFAGTGATAIAAKALHRKCIAIELDSGHFNRMIDKLKGI